MDGGEPEGEGRAAFGVLADGRPVMLLGDPADDREAETGAWAPVPVEPNEVLEDALALAGRNPGTVVDHSQNNDASRGVSSTPRRPGPAVAATALSSRFRTRAPSAAASPVTVASSTSEIDLDAGKPGACFVNDFLAMCSEIDLFAAQRVAAFQTREAQEIVDQNPQTRALACKLGFERVALRPRRLLA